MKSLTRIKTWILIAALGGLFVAIGSIWGTSGMIIALIIALVFNFSMYWFSDRIAVATSRAKPVTEQQYPELYRIVRELTQARGLPMPRIYVSEMMQPNAFATEGKMLATAMPSTSMSASRARGSSMPGRKTS